MKNFQLSQDTIDDFQLQGAVCIRNLFTPQEVESLKKGIQHNLENPSERAKIASNENDPGRFFEDFCNWQSNPYYEDFILNSAVASVSAQLMQSEQVRFYHDHLLVKEAKTQQKTPWHQDQPYYNIEGKLNCSMWMPVDPVSRSSTLEFVAGSHRGPWLMPRTFRDNHASWFPEGTLSELPDIESDRSKWNILGWELEPGDALFFHMLTLHASGGVSANTSRRAFSLRFLGDDITHAPRAWRTSPEFPGLTDELAAGAPMDHPLFPVIWPSA